MVVEAQLAPDTDSATAAGSTLSADQLPAPGFAITRLVAPADVTHHLPSLRTLLQSCVNPNPACSSLGFHAPLSDADADEFWLQCADQLSANFYIFVLTTTPARGEDATPARPSVLGTVSLTTIPKPAHRHRAEVAKLLVRADAQGRGLGRKLMEHLEDFAKAELGKEMLTLDTATETPARAFYKRLGWQKWGVCPRYADYADGRKADAAFFVKFLR